MTTDAVYFHFIELSLPILFVFSSFPLVLFFVLYHCIVPQNSKRIKKKKFDGQSKETMLKSHNWCSVTHSGPNQTFQSNFELKKNPTSDFLLFFFLLLWYVHNIRTNFDYLYTNMCTILIWLYIHPIDGIYTR